MWDLNWSIALWDSDLPLPLGLAKCEGCFLFVGCVFFPRAEGSSSGLPGRWRPGCSVRVLESSQPQAGSLCFSLAGGGVVASRTG